MLIKQRWGDVLAAVVMAGVVAGTTWSARAQEGQQGQPVPMPESAVTEQTTLAVWVDASQFTPAALRASAQTLQAALPDQMQQQKAQMGAQFDQGLAKFEKNYQAITDAGAQGMLMLLNVPADGSPPEEPVTLVRVKPGTTAEQLTNVAQQLNAGRPADANFKPYSERWLVAEKGSEAPTDGTAAEAQQLQDIFAKTEPAAVRVAFRMTPGFQKALEKAEQAQQARQGQPRGPMMNPAQQFTGPMQGLKTSWLSLNLGESPEIATGMAFDDAESAQQFNMAWNGVLGQARGFAQMMVNNPNAPQQIDPATIRDLFAALELEQDGAQLSNSLDEQFVKNVAKIVPALQGMMMGMGGGPGMHRGGPMPGPQPGPQEGPQQGPQRR